MMVERRSAVSLFSGAAIGDVGFRAAGIDFVVMAELEPERAALAARNFPAADVIVGDIWQKADEIAAVAAAAAPGGVFLVTCTAPCQGMSKNGQGTLLSNARRGLRPALDPRNRLILPALDVINALQPEWVVFENVSEMAYTVIEDRSGELKPILDVIAASLIGYTGRAYDVEVADYGVPQRRRRLITVYSRLVKAQESLGANHELVPPVSHSQEPGFAERPWISVADAIAAFPPLDASSRELARHPSIPFHRVPVLDSRKYAWVEATPPAASAFDNQCGKCGFGGNAVHGATRNDDGINQAKRTTPTYCERCGALLPRPHVVVEGRARIMSGYTSAYKRMCADLPAPALTRNLSYACSDQKLHPAQNRVLSLAEAFRVHTLDKYEYSWDLDGRPVRDGLIALVLGESIPPLLTELIGRHLIEVTSGTAAVETVGHRWPRVAVSRSANAGRQASKARRQQQLTAW